MGKRNVDKSRPNCPNDKILEQYKLLFQYDNFPPRLPNKKDRVKKYLDKRREAVKNIKYIWYEASKDRYRYEFRCYKNVGEYKSLRGIYYDEVICAIRAYDDRVLLEYCENNTKTHVDRNTWTRDYSLAPIHTTSLLELQFIEDNYKKLSPRDIAKALNIPTLKVKNIIKNFKKEERYVDKSAQIIVIDLRDNYEEVRASLQNNDSVYTSDEDIDALLEII